MLKENLNSHRYVLAKIPSEKYEKWTVKYPSRWNTRKNSNQTKRNINKWHINLNNIHLSVSFLAFYTFLQVFRSWGCSIPINGENMLIGTASQLEQTATWIHIRMDGSECLVSFLYEVTNPSSLSNEIERWLNYAKLILVGCLGHRQL